MSKPIYEEFDPRAGWLLRRILPDIIGLVAAERTLWRWCEMATKCTERYSTSLVCLSSLSVCLIMCQSYPPGGVFDNDGIFTTYAETMLHRRGSKLQTRGLLSAFVNRSLYLAGTCQSRYY